MLNQNEYIWYVEMYPNENLLITWKGVERLDCRWSLNDQLERIYNCNHQTAVKQAETSNVQSEKAKARNAEVKRKAHEDVYQPSQSFGPQGQGSCRFFVEPHCASSCQSIIVQCASTPRWIPKASVLESQMVVDGCTWQLD